jgi:chromate reductase
MTASPGRAKVAPGLARDALHRDAAKENPMPSTITVAALCGSLRKGSFNRMALAAAIARAPEDMKVAVSELGDIPPYDEDVREKGYPPPVARLRGEIAAADAVLFVTPEYNYSVPGVLKNAIDWASRPPEQPFEGKPCAIMGASISLLGTARAQYHLRQTCVFLNMYPLNRPEVMIASAGEKFAADGTLTDEKTGQYIARLMEALDAWTRRLKG